ncbi:MAG: hypothetical protein ACI9U2_003904 [Bradymonadia bacterium]|jgi:uncharacterized protein YndB with AHSA1/START domain
MIFWVIIGGGGIVGFVALMCTALWIVGGRLSESHEASASRCFKTAPETLFAFVTDPTALVNWRPDLRKVEALPSVDGRPAWRETSKHGRMQLVVEESLPPTTVAEGRYVTRVVESSAPFGGRWTWIFTPDGTGGTRLTITEEGIIASRTVRAMAHHMLGVDATVNAVLAALQRQLS